MKYVFNTRFNVVNTKHSIFWKDKFCLEKFSEGIMNA
jgi:hypothetical protein